VTLTERLEVGGWRLEVGGWRLEIRVQGAEDLKVREKEAVNQNPRLIS
jgi:hypothetical protein